MWLGFKRTLVYADHGIRFSGKPSYTFRKRLKLAIDILLSFSERPLKVAIGIGVILSTLSTLIAIWIVFGALQHGYSVTGWASLIISVFFLGGSILTALGVVGVYLGRVFSEVKKRPLYIVEEFLNQ
jgi:dolichol-phosphate mannosyltransferase